MRKAPLRPDPRLLLVLTVFYSLLIWKTSPAGLAVCVVLLVLLRLGLGGSAPAVDDIFRALRFALLWTALKALMDSMGFSKGGFDPAPVEALLGIAADAGLLGLRLFLLLLLSLGLTALVSAPAMGAALLRFLPPPLRRHGRLPAAGLAFMLRCLPEILAAARDTRLAARARGLPDKGPAFWKLALPQIFRLPALHLHSLATAAAVRGFDAPEAWTLPRNRNGYPLLFFFLLAGAIPAYLM